MKKKIEQILDKYIDAYSFVSTKEYILTRQSLHKNDLYDDYTKAKEYSTIITVGLSYSSDQLSYKKGYGRLSRYSYGKDYHLVMKDRLTLIEKELEVLGIAYYSSVDTGPIDERWASYLSGLGMLGKNQYLIHRKYGGYLYLATILINLEIEKEFTVLDTCGDCDLCVKSCPTNALDGGFIQERCISETTQSKKELTDNEIKYINTLVYGCDICQRVCPKNKGINFTHNKEFTPTGIEQVPLHGILQMTNKEYHDIYQNNASSWKGPLIIKRNALCLLLNKGDTSSIPLIKESIDKYSSVLWYNNVAKRVLKQLEVKKK
jgi:epoxyqueuosine reductase